MTKQVLNIEGAFIKETKDAINENFSEVYENVIDGGIRFINSAEDFPEAVNGVITLEDNKTYFICGNIDLEGDRILCGQNTTILGGSSESCSLSSTGLSGTALITSEWSLPIR